MLRSVCLDAPAGGLLVRPARLDDLEPPSCEEAGYGQTVHGSESFAVCPLCQRRVDPNAAGVVYAVEQVRPAGVGHVAEIVDGNGAFFHPGCPPATAGYVPRPLPGADLLTP